MATKDEVRKVISTMPGDNWQDKVKFCAKLADRSESTVYKWLSETPKCPDNTLNGIKFKLLEN